MLALASVEAKADGYSGSIKDAPPAPEVYQWNGLSVGVGIGVGLLDRSVSVEADKRAKKEYCHYHYGSYNCSPASSGWHDYDGPWNKAIESAFGDDNWNGFGTLQVGYDRLLGDRILVGAFADFDFYVDADSAFSSYEKYGKSHAWIDGDVDLKNVWSVGGRLGFLVTPRVLLYGVGGYTEARVDGTASATFKWDGNPAHTVSMELPDEMKGYFVGGGAELKLDKNLSLKLEYRYSHFGSEGVSAGNKFTDTSSCYCDYLYRVKTDINAGTDIDMDIHSVRAALVFKLGDLHDRGYEPLK